MSALAILTDMQMPHMDGLACLRVRSMRAFDDTPIVVLSAGGSSSERMGAVAQLRGVMASSKSMPMKALVALLRAGCTPTVASVSLSP